LSLSVIGRVREVGKDLGEGDLSDRPDVYTIRLRIHGFSTVSRQVGVGACSAVAVGRTGRGQAGQRSNPQADSRRIVAGGGTLRAWWAAKEVDSLPPA
jgi:hypothetical protein